MDHQAQTPFAKAVQQARIQAGISQAELARKANTSIRTISRLESKGHTPGYKIIAKISQALNVDVGNLLPNEQAIAISHHVDPGPSNVEDTNSLFERIFYTLETQDVHHVLICVSILGLPVAETDDYFLEHNMGKLLEQEQATLAIFSPYGRVDDYSLLQRLNAAWQNVLRGRIRDLAEEYARRATSRRQQNLAGETQQQEEPLKLPCGVWLFESKLPNWPVVPPVEPFCLTAAFIRYFRSGPTTSSYTPYTHIRNLDTFGMLVKHPHRTQPEWYEFSKPEQDVSMFWAHYFASALEVLEPNHLLSNQETSLEEPDCHFWELEDLTESTNS